MRYLLTVQWMNENGQELPPYLASQHLSWPDFLAALEEFCQRQGWDIEFGSVDAESCAIFYYDHPNIETVRPDYRLPLAHAEQEGSFRT